MSRFRSEIKALVPLALPVSLAQLALVGMTATDVLIAGNAGTIDLAGMNLGANIWNMLSLFFMGIGFATQPLVANQFGANNDQGVRHQLHQSLWMCFFLGICSMFAVIAGAQLMLQLNYQPEMLRIAHDYMMAISLCAVPLVMISAIRGTLEGVSQTRSVLWITLAAFLLNIPLDYIFVNGLYGFPRLGGVGCAWATVILVWSMFLAMLFVGAWHKAVRHMRLLSSIERPKRQTIRRTLRMGVPIGLSVVLELSMFSGAGVLIAYFGPVQAGAHAVAITVASLSFMIYMGLGQGVTIRASQFLGAGRNDLALYSVKAGIAFNLMIATVFCILFFLFADVLVGLFSSDTEVIKLAVVLLYFGAVFQIADCLQVAAVCALRAYHDTDSPLKYQFFAFWVLGLPIGVGLAFYNWWPELEAAKGLWFGMVLSLFIVGVLLLFRLRSLVVSGEHERIGERIRS